MSSAHSRSSNDPLSRALDAAADAVVTAVIAVQAANPVVLIDGQSGAGKTTLARRVVARWASPGRVQSVGLDSVYPGWDGLDDGVEYARTTILVPHARGMIGVWERWDWSEARRAEAHAVDPSLPLVVEGSGLLTRQTARLGDVRVWLQAPASSRRQRAIDRDGDTYLPHWERWAAQEEAHLARDEPARHATLVVAVP